MSAHGGRLSARRPVLMMAPGGLADEVTRLAAAAGCDPQRIIDPNTIREQWNCAPLVLLDIAAAMASASAGLPRRDGVVVICANGDPEVWRCAVAVGASAGLPRRDGVVVICGNGDPEVWRCAVAVGAAHVAVLPDAEAWLVGALADALEFPADPGRVLAVLGGRGGAGASVFAAAVAVTVADAGRQAMLVDCDALGGGLDLTLGAEKLDGLRWSGLALGGGRVPISALHAALPTPHLGGGLDLTLGAEKLDGLRWSGLTLGGGRVPISALHAALPTPHLGGRGGLTVLSCDREGPGPDGTAVRTVCGAGRRAGETVVCDLPRYPCESGTAALETADLAVLVVPAEVRACAAAAMVASRVRRYGVALQLVVRGPAPGGITPADVSRTLDLPLLAAMRPQPRLAAALDRGVLPGRSRGPLATAARQVLAVLDGFSPSLGSAA